MDAPAASRGEEVFKRSVVGAALIGTVVALAVPAASDGAGATACTLQVHVRFSKPISLSPNAGRLLGDHGTITCDGTLAGVNVAGTAPVRLRGTYGAPLNHPMFGGAGRDDCASGVADVRFTAVLTKNLRQHEAVRLAGLVDLKRTALAYQGAANGTARARGPRAKWTAGVLGALRPDGDQACPVSRLASGTLTLRFSISQ
jgi:hypothetical protein